LLAAARELRFSVTPQGARTGLSGGALAIQGGVALDLRAMNRILEIDRENLYAVVEPGVVTEALQDAAGVVGLFYPPDPSSRGSCTLGGNIAENAGGPRAAKYGTTGRYVSGLRVALPGGGRVGGPGGADRTRAARFLETAPRRRRSGQEARALRRGGLRGPAQPDAGAARRRPGGRGAPRAHGDLLRPRRRREHPRQRH